MTKGCEWRIDEQCQGKVSKEELFGHQIRVSVCERHLKCHKNIVLLHHSGYDIEKILAMSFEEMENEIKQLNVIESNKKEIC